MRNVNRLQIQAVALVCIIASACAVRNQNGGTTLPQTALEWTIIYNAAVAKTNRAVEQAVETVQNSGAITSNQARPIILTCGKVAQTSEAVRAITSQGTEATWAVDGPKIRGILAAANLQVPVSTNQTIDLAVAAVNASILLLTQGVK